MGDSWHSGHVNACWISAEIYRAVDTLFGEILKDFLSILLPKFVLLLSLYEFETVGASRDLLSLTTPCATVRTQ